MEIRFLLWLFLMVVVPEYVWGSDILIKNVVVYDRTGNKPFRADVRIKGDHRHRKESGRAGWRDRPR